MPRTPRTPRPPAAPAAEQPAAPAPKQLDIVIDRTKLMLPDLALLSRIRRGAGRDEEAIELLDRVVVGGISTVPFDALGHVLDAVFQVVYRSANPETPEGN